ncbi:hypothetical protein MHF_0446 [Mycoplasma haemofelis Ohio2]|uniref:Uncharacterized protein n=1 Tax=Mycoplasma haemofelis (strain Ohio2) TaxID=859194 RepID=F6FHI3_MYCHI|nr:hypothetical protein MHF_0446 [Mycoplasma haemofelis Ohio2]
MAVSTLTKSVALLGGIGSSVGGYFLVSNLSSNSPEEIKVVTSISDRLRSEGYTLLDFSNTTSNGWEKIKTAYKGEETGNRRFSEIKQTSDNALIAEIKDSCSKYLQGDSSNEDNYKMSRRWCIVPLSVKDKLKNKTFLNTENTTDDNTWAEMVKKNGANEFLTLAGDQNDEAKKTQIKKQCGEKAKLETTDINFEEALEKVGIWCTKETSAPQAQ